MQSIEVRTHSENPLAQSVAEVIDNRGSISFREYMEYSLHGIETNGSSYVPGFYTSGDAVIGENGTRDIPQKNVDFVTPPEISPLYGYTMAKQIKQFSEILGRPDSFHLTIMGDGNGTLMYDIVHGLSLIDDEYFNNYTFASVEASPYFASRQEELYRFCRGAEIPVLQEKAQKIRIDPFVGAVLSVELADTFPVHVVRDNAGCLEELFITNKNRDSFGYTWNEPTDECLDFLAQNPQEIGEGLRCAVSPDIAKWQEAKSSMLSQGFVVDVDYDRYKGMCGEWPIGAYGALLTEDTWEQGIEPMLDKSMYGKIDITAGVDFQLLADLGIAHGMRTEGYVMNTGWLWGLGFDLHQKDESIQIPGRTRILKNEWLLRRSKLWNVLVQSKNAPPANIDGLLRIDNPDDTIEEDTSFRPIV